jgi:SAM-dependent methyltransferase
VTRMRPHLRSELVRRASRRYARARLADRRLPVSDDFGFDRGVPIDRHYIARFLSRFACAPGYAAGDIRGRVLEIGGREYVDRFGVPNERPGSGLVHQVDVLHESTINAEATIVGDLASPQTLPVDTFNCIICTQVLPVIWDTRAVLENLHASLRSGGVLLLTVPGITRSLVTERDHWGDFWRFTAESARRLALEAFEGGRVEVDVYGNLQAATFFLHGFASHELSLAELELRDPAFEVMIGVRARKRGERDGG